MQWTEVNQEKLRGFLEGFTNPDPLVQASNLEQLQALSDYPSALVSILAIVCNAGASVTVRLSATTVARQLLRCSDRLPLYLSAAGEDPATAAQSIAEALFDAALEGSSCISSETTATPLQRATGNLIACLLSGLTHTSLEATAIAVWSRIISSLLQRTDLAMATVNDAFQGGRWHTAQRGALCASLLRAICGEPFSTSRVLREWVGGQAAESLALCSLFTQLLQLLERHMEMEQAAIGAAARFYALWLEETLIAFQVCMESGLLPCAPSDFLSAPASDASVTPPGAGNSSSTGLSEGPSMQALRTVGTAVCSVQSSVQSLVLRHALGHLELVGGQSPDGAVLREAVMSAAPFVAVGMRYIADSIALDSTHPLHGAFHVAATPLLARFCHAACLCELQYDGAGESKSVHGAVLACITYLTEYMNIEAVTDSAPSSHLAAHSAHPSAVSAPAEDYVSCLYSMLVDAATLPPSVAGALEEHTTHQPDSPADFLVKSAAGRRRDPCGFHAQKTYDEGDSIAAETAGGTWNAPAVVMQSRCGKQDDTLLADALEVALPDNGTLRQAVAWCAVGLSCRQEWMMVVAPLVLRPATIFPLTRLDSACTTESALFVNNEFLDSILADSQVSTSLAGATPELLERNIAAQVEWILRLLIPPTQGGFGTHAPFFVRIQAVRYLGRLVVGLLEAWQHTSRSDHVGQSKSCIGERTRTVMLAVGGLEKLLGLVCSLLTTEVSKATQVECVKTLNSALTSCLKAIEEMMRRSVTDADASDLEEESLDSTSTSCGDMHADGKGGDEAVHPVHGDPCERVRLFCESFGTTMELRVMAEVLHVVSSHLPSFQWSVRQAVYHLFSEVLPSLWRVARLLDCSFASQADDTHPGASYSARLITAQVLEALAQHYGTLLRDSSLSGKAFPMLEMATLLTSMADVTSAMDGAALEMVVPWILQVAHHMLDLYANYLTRRAHSNHLPTAERESGVVDMTDMCMVSLDLVSCVCDGVIDRDSLLEQQLRPREAGGAFESMDARVITLATSMLLPQATRCIGCDGTLDSDSGAEALPNRCMALLSVCQSLSDHPTHDLATPSSVSGDGSDEDEALCHPDEFGDVRRACFAIVYDCVFLVAYHASLFRPLNATVAPDTGLVSSPRCISDSLGRNLFALCVREVIPSRTPLSVARSADYAAHFRFVSAHNAAASDAWLCLGSLLSLWDQQHWQTRRSAPSGTSPTYEGEGGPRSVFCICEGESTVELHSNCLHILDDLLALLKDKRATVMSNMRLNMTTAACGLAVLLCDSDLAHTNSGSRAPGCPLPFATISSTFSVVPSTRIQEYAPDASNGDLSGISEAAHVLWCLGRLWQEAVQPLPHDALCSFVRLHGKEITKTILWWTRCVFKVKNRLTPSNTPASASGLFWESLLELWRPVARTLVQAAQWGVLSLTRAQISELGQLEQL